MRLHQTPLPHYTSDLLTVPHGMFTVAGGTSAGLFATLNLSHHVDDLPERVQANRAQTLAALGLTHLISVHQVHGDQILLADQVHSLKEIAGYDAIISTLPGTGLLIQQADCQAVLLWSPARNVIAAVHCGWRGSALGIIGATIRCMQEYHGVNPADLRAVVSPSLGPCCAEFVNYRTELPAWMHAYQVRPQYFDFWEISRHQLCNAGICADHIEVAGLCTRCDPRFFSYRRASATSGGVTGRNGSIIGLPAVG